MLLYIEICQCYIFFKRSERRSADMSFKFSFTVFWCLLLFKNRKNVYLIISTLNWKTKNEIDEKSKNFIDNFQKSFLLFLRFLSGSGQKQDIILN